MGKSQELMDLAELLYKAARLEDETLTKVPGSVNTATLLNQPGGIFSTSGLETDIVSLHVRPSGIGGAIPSFGASITDPRYGFLTGFTDDEGSEPTNPCDDAPTGYIKSGTLTASFGKVTRMTPTMVADDILEEQRGSTSGLRLLGSLLGSDNEIRPNMTDQQVLDLVTKANIVSVGVRMERKLSTMIWNGTPSANTAGNGYREFPGLENQVATGQVDAETNVALPSADSYLLDFNYNDVGGTALDIVEYFAMAEYYLAEQAMRQGLDPVQFVVVMPPQLWQHFTEVWPCRYMTNRCTTSTGSNPMVINDDNNIRMRDAMREGKYVEVNGRRLPVITDTGITEANNITDGNVPAGSFASSIFILPLTVVGNFPVLYWEYKDYRGLTPEINVMGQGASKVNFWSDEGRFLWGYEDTGAWCWHVKAKTEPRIVLRTPHLAARIQNVMYSPITHIKSPYPDSPYHFDGGTSIVGVTEGYAVWR
jgi:hypothetical protein